MGKNDLALQIVMAVFSIFLGTISFFCLEIEMYKEIPFILAAILLAVFSAALGGVKWNSLVWILLISILIVLLSRQLMFDYTNSDNPQYYFHMGIIGSVFWGGIIIVGFLAPIYKRNQVFLGEIEEEGGDKIIKFYSSGDQKNYLGSVEFKNDTWKVFVTSGDLYFRSGDRFFKKIERMAKKKYPEGK